ncbi:hypothetical protein BDR06DRAFT_1030599, partial [Suillus hirtellus]
MVCTTLKGSSIGCIDRSKSKGKRKAKGAFSLSATNAMKHSTAVPLCWPITSFAILLVHAEIVMDDSLKNDDTRITYREPQEIEVIQVGTTESYKMCHVLVLEGGKKYQDLWLELSHNIVLCSKLWELWEEEGMKKLKGKKTNMVETCRKNTGVMLVQHMLTRRLVVEQLLKLDYLTEPGKESIPLLDEWKIRMCHDWWNKSYDEAFTEGREFLSADLVTAPSKAFFSKSIASACARQRVTCCQKKDGILMTKGR